jgi:hypothetical protein
MCCPACLPEYVFLAVCLICQEYAGPLPVAEADQAAAEHDHDRHHGEPTATVHRARVEAAE